MPLNKDFINVSKVVEGKTVLVTGGAGSVGRALVLRLIPYRPKRIIILDHAETPIHNLNLEIGLKSEDFIFTPIICDIRNKDYLDYLFGRYTPDIIFHCAAYKHVTMMEDNPFEAVSVNIEGTMILSDLSQKYSVDRFVMISTDKVVEPSSVMGATKYIAESYVSNLNNENRETITKFITVRFGNVLGSNGSVIELFKSQLKKDLPLTVTHKDAFRYFISKEEVSKLIVEACSMGHGGEVFIFDMGEAISILALAKRLSILSGLCESEIRIDIIGLKPGEKLREKLFNDNERVQKTLHPKILELTKENYSGNAVITKSILDDLITISKNYEILSLMDKISYIIPGFTYSSQ